MTSDCFPHQVPGFAMLIVTLLLSGALIILERADGQYGLWLRRNQSGGADLDDGLVEPLGDGFEAMWMIFWCAVTECLD
jgi:hypothetical protein